MKREQENKIILMRMRQNGTFINWFTNTRFINSHEILSTVWGDSPIPTPFLSCDFI